ncbi:MAG: hypothetical protein ACOC7T_05730 [Planctomycetota bacterium]
MHVIDPHLLHLPTAGEPPQSVQRRLLDAISWATALGTDRAWLISRECLIAAANQGLLPQYHQLGRLFQSWGIDLNAQDVWQALSPFLERQSYLEELWLLEGVPKVSTVTPDSLVFRLPDSLQDVFCESLRRIAGSSGPDEATDTDTTLASTACESEEIEIVLEGETPYQLAWEEPPAAGKPSLAEIAKGYKHFAPAVREAYKMLVPAHERDRFELKAFRVGPDFVSSIESTHTHQDETRLQTLGRRTALFLCGKHKYNAHEVGEGKTVAGCELWHFYLTQGRAGWRVQFYRTPDGMVLYRITKHDEATR